MEIFIRCEFEPLALDCDRSSVLKLNALQPDAGLATNRYKIAKCVGKLEAGLKERQTFDAQTLFWCRGE